MRRTLTAMSAATVACIMLTTAAMAAPANPYPAAEVMPGAVYACLSEKSGDIRVPKPKTLGGKEAVQCRRSEKLIIWSQVGQTGPAGQVGQAGIAGATGSVGATGPAGPAGPAGATGPAGPAGVDGSDGLDGSDAIPNVLYSYKTGFLDSTSITTAYTPVIALTGLGGYYLVSFSVRLGTVPTADVYCMLTGGSMNGAFLLDDKVNNPARIVASSTATASGTFPVRVPAFGSTGDLTVKCTTASGTVDVKERSISATEITSPTFQNWVG